MDRTISGPDQEWLTEEEMVAWLRLPGTLLQDLIDAGIMPQPWKFSAKTQKWPWEVAVAVSLLLKHSPGLLAIAQAQHERNKAK